jgi:hypothetical protein
VIVRNNDFPDSGETSDHRPVELTVSFGGADEPEPAASSGVEEVNAEEILQLIDELRAMLDRLEAMVRALEP